VLNSLKNMMLLTVQASVANLNPREEMRKKIVRQHRQLYEAVIAGKPANAQKVAMAHVRFVSEAMRDMEKDGGKLIRLPIEQDKANDHLRAEA
jgi:GntR family transcriptional repressor for pyruvate dehydrogenase complex/GntR family transcriptional activator of glc operon